MKKTAHHLITEAPRRQARPELTIGIDLGDVWSHYCTLSEDGEVVDRGRFRTTAKAIQKLLQICLQHVWPWRPAFTRSGLASNLRS